MASKHANAFQYSEPCTVPRQYPMLDPKEGLQLPCSCQHQDIIFLHTAVLDLASKHWCETLFECIVYGMYFKYEYKTLFPDRSIQQMLCLVLNLNRWSGCSFSHTEWLIPTHGRPRTGQQEPILWGWNGSLHILRHRAVPRPHHKVFRPRRFCEESCFSQSGLWPHIRHARHPVRFLSSVRSSVSVNQSRSSPWKLCFVWYSKWTFIVSKHPRKGLFEFENGITGTRYFSENNV